MCSLNGIEHPTTTNERQQDISIPQNNQFIASQEQHGHHDAFHHVQGGPRGQALARSHMRAKPHLVKASLERSSRKRNIPDACNWDRLEPAGSGSQGLLW
jgi:hypothetical protein